MLLSKPNISFRRAPSLNLATLLPDSTTVGNIEHDCLQLVDSVTSPHPDLPSTPLANPDLVLFTDGSSYRPYDTATLAGYAIVTPFAVLEAFAVPPGISAQAAELFALTRACILAEGRTANIYTDSWYTFGVVHDFGTLWQHHGFINPSGKPIQHATLISNLLRAILRPRGLAYNRGKTPAKFDHLPVPAVPFGNLQIDFVHMPLSGGFKYILVIVDMFSKWVKAFATRRDYARTVETGLKWPEALPITLYTLRNQVNRTTGLTPFEVLMGRLMTTGTKPTVTGADVALIW
eukprot:g48214.t1